MISSGLGERASNFRNTAAFYAYLHGRKDVEQQPLGHQGGRDCIVIAF